ncbi:DUF6090 family protein [Robiginitalea sp. SC105]|uniref:DUF6090 family protein n=1 Tax=Robiginitalea sp. SC105 TaxID=2762332 RepID=UPI00163A7139|nr:DUF6090 family protein [Robiginitalea sp. SC105]MBC2838855.1 hypothetical protein [Robiginitalea sp. SC105]
MLRFFRQLRQRLLTENKFRKYLLYAIGEILLVVIGILIALQINNANEYSKQKQQLLKYEQNIVSELKEDLKMLNGLDSLNSAKVGTILSYINYFKNPTRDADTVIQRMYDIQYNGGVYKSIAYTIDEIINTGNLSLFSSEAKTAILELKAIQEFYEKNRIEVEQKWVLSNIEFENAIDLVSYNEFPTAELRNMKDWRFDLGSDQYRLFNNKTLAELRVFYFRTDQNNKMRTHSEKLLNLLEKN